MNSECPCCGTTADVFLSAEFLANPIKRLNMLIAKLADETEFIDTAVLDDEDDNMAILRVQIDTFLGREKAEEVAGHMNAINDTI